MPTLAQSTRAWFPVARAADVGTTPVPVGAAGQSYVVVRLRPAGEVSAFPARCPHRLVPLAAGTVGDGRLQCPYHGWRFDAEGRCVDIPSLGPDGTPPPRADLPTPWAVEERGGWVWIAPCRTAERCPAAPTSAPQPGPAPPAPPPARPGAGPGTRAAAGGRARQHRPLAGARLAPGGAVPRAA